MRLAFVLSISILALTVTVRAAEGGRDHHHDHHHHGADGGASFVPPDYPAAFGFSLTEGWRDPWPHSHFSRENTPFIHMFNIEPAYLDRDLFLVYKHTKEDHGTEQELELELEWAFTRRIGVAVHVPIERHREAGHTETGFGDLSIAPRVLLVDAERFLLSGNLGLTLPTGSERRGLGRGEYAIAPSITTWTDLGNWVTLQTQLGTEHGLSSGEADLFYGAGLSYSFLGPRMFRRTAHGVVHGHYPPGLTTLMMEVVGRTALRKEDRGRTTAEMLLGIGYSLTDAFEIRGGYQFPITGRRDMDRSWLLSVIYHF
jgi:hypothetical protein